MNPEGRKPIKSYKDLLVWQKPLDIVDAVYDATERFPRHEIFGLFSQLRRCAVSIPSNIAEGHGRHRLLDYRRFLDIARGSLQELETQIIISTRRGYMSEPAAAQLAARLEEVAKMLYGLIKALPAA